MLNNINLTALEEYNNVITEKPLEAISSYGIIASWKEGVKIRHGKRDQNLTSRRRFERSC